jgi:Glycosyl transferases group 1
MTVAPTPSLLMDTFSAKPTLIFFQYKYDDKLPAFLLAHKREHVKCLSQFFNVVVVDHDCDYEQICDMHQPDLTLFESGVPFPSCDRPKITNPRAYSKIPKLGFLHSDAFCCGRAGFLSDMDHLGIATYFAIATAAAENTPAISDSLFVWPNFVDPELYRDFGLWKSIPVLFAGNNSALYPWRQRMVRLISKNYPSLICNHPGYGPQKAQQQTRVGEPYARMLNASWFVPSCGTLAKEVVRKHFEVPACKSCLVAEPSPALEAAGFIDMVNCVFADEHDVLDKLSFLFNDQDALEKIVQAGFELVHRYHTIKQRDQILQWYELNKAIQPHQKIVQSGPFEPLRLVDGSSGRIASGLIPNGLHLQLLRQGDQLLWQHDYKGAERFYLKCAQYIPWMPEPKLRLALCNLYKGNAKAALSWISEPIQFTLSEYRAVDPDPVEWAYFILATICSGDLGEAIKRAKQFPWLRHQELDRARRASMILAGRRIMLPAENGQLQERRRSIHQLPQRSDDEWFITLCDMLTACNRCELAEKLRNYLNRDISAFEDVSNCKSDTVRQQAKSNDELAADDTRSVATPGTMRYFRWRLRFSKMRESLKKVIKRGLYSVETKFGYFMPHHLSSSRNDEFYKMICDLARGEKVGTALVLGADWRARTTQALIAGFREREEQSLVLGLRIKGRSRGPGVSGQASKDDFVKWYGPLSPDSGDMRDQLQKAIIRIKEDNNVECFDVLLIDGCVSVQEEHVHEALQEVLRTAKYVLLDDVNYVHIHEIYRRLQKEGRHCVTGENPNLRNGYAVFERLQWQ